MIGGNIIVELPWLASKMDVLLCYAFLKAIKKVHRAVHVIDEEDKSVKLTEDEAKEQWHLRRSNMDEIINRGEKTVIAGVMRDFHLNPALYIGRDEIANRIEDAFADFITVQWTNLEAVNIREERRHITEEEELSTIRVIDNTEDVFIGVCQYVGMMKGNTCKMVKFEDFCHLMEKQDEFQLLDDAQALLDKMDDEQWNELFNKAAGIVRENFRKTFIMRWNTDISNYKLSEFEDAMEDFFDDGFYYDWSIWDYQKAHIGDKFYMIRTGEGKNGVVMRGTIIGTPYPDEDWSGKGRKVYYIRMSLTNTELYSLLKSNIDALEQDEAGIIFIPFPVVPAFNHPILSMTSDVLQLIYNQLVENKIVNGRDIYFIYPSMKQNEYVLRDCELNKEFIDVPELEDFVIYESDIVQM